MYDLAAGKVRYSGPTSFPSSPTIFSPNGRWVATAQSHIIRVWDMDREKPVGPTDGHVGGVTSLAFALDGKAVAAITTDSLGYHLWETTTGRELVDLEKVHAAANRVGQVHPNRAGRVGPSAFQCSPDGKVLAAGSCGDDGTIWLVDASTGKEIRRFVEGTHQVRSLAFSEDGRILASKHRNKICLWDTATGKEKSHFQAGLTG